MSVEDNSFNHICKKIGMKTKLPWVSKLVHKKYKSYYTPELKEFVHSLHNNDFEIFKYIK
jgi:hypothetical protein